jgi:hypothetical protein
MFLNGLNNDIQF